MEVPHCTLCGGQILSTRVICHKCSKAAVDGGKCGRCGISPATTRKRKNGTPTRCQACCNEFEANHLKAVLNSSDIVLDDYYSRRKHRDKDARENRNETKFGRD